METYLLVVLDGEEREIPRAWDQMGLEEKLSEAVQGLSYVRFVQINHPAWLHTFLPQLFFLHWKFVG